MASKNPKEIKEQLEELIKTHQSYADNEGYLFVVSPWGIIKDW
mgnify:CR=1 FL=1